MVAGVSYANGGTFACGDFPCGDFVLARYWPNGTLDSTFGGDGTVLTTFGSGRDDHATALALQPDGKIVVAGGSNGAFALARYLPNGTLDPTFSGDGKVLTDFGGVANALAIQPNNGRLVVAGWSTARGNTDFALARYLPNGTLDATFGGDGTVRTTSGVAALMRPPLWPFRSTARSWWPDIPARPVAALTLPWRAICLTEPSIPASAAMAQYSPTSRSGGFANALAIQADGKIVVAGESNQALCSGALSAQWRPGCHLWQQWHGAHRLR